MKSYFNIDVTSTTTTNRQKSPTVHYSATLNIYILILTKDKGTRPWQKGYMDALTANNREDTNKLLRLLISYVNDGYECERKNERMFIRKPRL